LRTSSGEREPFREKNETRRGIGGSTEMTSRTWTTREGGGSTEMRTVLTRRGVEGDTGVMTMNFAAHLRQSLMTSRYYSKYIWARYLR
jgi:hypothetical protein